MKRVLSVFLLPALVIGASLADLQASGDLQAWSTNSISNGYGPLASYWNPALLGLNTQDFECEVFGFFNDDGGRSSDEFAVFTRMGGLGIGMEHLEANDGALFANRYRVGLSQGGDKIKGGLAYAWSVGNSDFLKQPDQLIYGFLAQPKSWASLGANSTNFLGENNGRVDRLLEAGLAFRPLRLFSESLEKRLTLSLDYAWDYVGEDLEKNSEQRWASLEAAPFDFLSFGVKRNLRTDDMLTQATVYWRGFGIGISESMADSAGTLEPGTRFHLHMSSAEFNRHYPTTPKRKKWARLNLEGMAGEYAWMGVGSSFQLLNFLEQMDAAEVDPTLKGILVDWKPGFGTDLTLLHEIRERLVQWKQKTGGELVFYSHGLSMGSLYISSICDRHAMLPVGDAELPPFGREGLYYADALEHAGIDFVRYNIGAYKGAGENFDLNAMSPEVKENVGRALQEIWDFISEEIRKGYDIAPGTFNAMMNRWMITKDELLDFGLVDTLLYDDELEDWALGRDAEDEKTDKKKGFSISLGISFGDKSDPAAESIVPLSSLVRETHDYTWGDKDAIAVIYANGPIMRGESLGPYIIGNETVVAQLKAARENEHVKAVVFHIDSPGGSGYASDLIWREMMRVKEEKPLIINQGFLAASGGYYLSMAGDSILTMPTTITGSIGVAAGIFFDKGLVEAAHLHQDGTWAGKDDSIGGAMLTMPLNFEAGTASMRFPAIPVMGRPLTKSQDKDIRLMISDFYQDFVGKVADCRGVEWDDIHAIAEGRIWAGGSALENGLVDGMGGLGEAIDAACFESGVNRNRVDLIEYYPGFTFADLIKIITMSQGRGVKMGMEMVREEAEMKAASLPIEIMGSGRPELLMDASPFAIEVK